MAQVIGILTNIARTAITLGVGGSLLNSSLYTGKLFNPLVEENLRRVVFVQWTEDIGQ